MASFSLPPDDRSLLPRPLEQHRINSSVRVESSRSHELRIYRRRDGGSRRAFGGCMTKAEAVGAPPPPLLLLQSDAYQLRHPAAAATMAAVPSSCSTAFVFLWPVATGRLRRPLASQKRRASRSRHYIPLLIPAAAPASFQRCSGGAVAIPLG